MQRSAKSSSPPGSPQPLALRNFRARMERVFSPTFVRRLTAMAALGMFLVIAMGVVVTRTNSGEGCGNTWPLCHGQFIPGFAITSAIENSHRIVSEIEGLLVVAAAVGVLYYWRSRLEMRILAPLMVFFMVLEAALGAFVVKVRPTPPELHAFHFGVSSIAFVSVLLTAILLYGERTYDRLRDRPIRTPLRWLVWGLTVFAYVTVSTGAFVSHEGAALACQQWPLCNNGQLAPSLTGEVGLVLAHRAAAVLMTVGAIWLFAWTRRLRRARPDLYWGSVAVLVGVLLQAIEGAFIVLSRVSLLSAVLHSSVVTLLFGALAFLTLYVLPRPASVRTPLVRKPASRPIDSGSVGASAR